MQERRSGRSSAASSPCSTAPAAGAHARAHCRDDGAEGRDGAAGAARGAELGQRDCAAAKRLPRKREGARARAQAGQDRQDRRCDAVCAHAEEEQGRFRTANRAQVEVAHQAGARRLPREGSRQPLRERRVQGAHAQARRQLVLKNNQAAREGANARRRTRQSSSRRRRKAGKAKRTARDKIFAERYSFDKMALYKKLSKEMSPERAALSAGFITDLPDDPPSPYKLP